MRIGTVNVGVGGVSCAVVYRRLRVLLAACVGVAVFVVVLPVVALGAGDVNVASCPVSTEAAPGFSSGLPDCRAYELVSEANTDDLGNITEPYGFPEGEHFVYDSWLPVPGGGAGAGVAENFLATRTGSGWRQTAISVPQGEGPTELTLAIQANTEGVDLTDGFADALMMSPFQDPLEAPRLNESTGAMVYDVSLDGGGVSTVSLPDSGPVTQSLIEFPAADAIDGTAHANGWGMFLQGASEDGSRVFFSTSARLATAPGTPRDTHQASSEIYERTDGHTYLVGVLPDGEVPVCGASVGQGDGGTGEVGEYHYVYGAIAPDGSNVVFQTPGEVPEGAACTEKEAGVFLRNVVNGTTVKLPGQLYAGRAGTKPGEEEQVFTAEGGSIYDYHIASGQSTLIATGTLGLLAWSPNGSRVYYLGPEEGIYMYEEGAEAPKLIPGTQAGGYRGEFGGWALSTRNVEAGEDYENVPVTAADGAELLFVSADKLHRGYNNCADVTVAGKRVEQCHREVYLYNANTETVSCISYGMTVPVGRSGLVEDIFSGAEEGKARTSRSPVEPLIYSRPEEEGAEAVRRVVFESTEALVPQDTNGAMDVYEWESEETEGCSRASLKLNSLEESPAYSAQDEGCIYLLTSGTGEEVPNTLGASNGSHLVGASEDLNDIYFNSEDALWPGVDGTQHIYDLRADGGFPYTGEESHGCAAGLCRSESEQPSFNTPSSVTFAGEDNTRPAPVVTQTKKKKTKAALSRAQKLDRTLRACKRKPIARRRACEAAAKRRYAARPIRAKKPTRGGGRS